MNSSLVEKVANAVLYEGYMLYPYRRSAVKNQQRFNFGVLYPREYSELQAGSDNWLMQTECLAIGNAASTVEAKIRFLQLVERDDRQEAIEREICMSVARLHSLATRPLRYSFHFEGIDGELELRSEWVDSDSLRITLVARNLAQLENVQANREEVLLQSLVSVHSILHIENGAFISSIDPPEKYRTAVGECRNIGAWPVLAGEEGQVDTVLSAPIILYDYPQIAPESAGDLFDGTEIDEILQLRILTMTDDEKHEVRNGDDRARLILERTESLPPEHFQKLHGALRGMRPPSEGAP